MRSSRTKSSASAKKSMGRRRSARRPIAAGRGSARLTTGIPHVSLDMTGARDTSGGDLVEIESRGYRVEAPGKAAPARCIDELDRLVAVYADRLRVGRQHDHPV